MLLRGSDVGDDLVELGQIMVVAMVAWLAVEAIVVVVMVAWLASWLFGSDVGCCNGG